MSTSAAMLWLPCPACRSAGGVGFTGPEATKGTCRACQREVSAHLFPKAFRPATPPPIKAPIAGDAVCYYDPTQKATCLCSQCGVLASDAWSANWGSQRICLRCLEKLRQDGRDSRFETTRVMWDNICLLFSLAVCSPMPYIGAITGPVALVLGLRAWNKPRSMVPRSRWRLVLGLGLASLQVIGLVVAVYFIIQAMLSGEAS